MKREAVAVAVIVGYALAVVGLVAFASGDRASGVASIRRMPGKLWADVREAVDNAR